MFSLRLNQALPLSFILSALFFSLSTASGITASQLRASFYTYPDAGPGGCGRNAPNGQAMMNFILTSLEDAWAMSDAMPSEMGIYFSGYSGKRARGLLFLLFGIKFTDRYDIEPDDDSNQNYQNILGIFAQVSALRTAPSKSGGGFLPRLRCLEDYATYSEHVIGDDGKENKTGPLVNGQGLTYEFKMPNGQYYPGLMYVDTPLKGWYAGSEQNPSEGACSDNDNQKTLAFTTTNAAGVLNGITMCPDYFKLPLTSSLGEPDDTVTDTSEIDKWRESAGTMMLHEMVHLASLNDIIDINAAVPPRGTDGKLDWTNRNWAQWSLVAEFYTYGYEPAVYLGLSKPDQALRNADNYAVLAVCLVHEDLDCLGTFQNDIKKKRRLPFNVAPRTIEKIRSGRLNLLEDF